MASALPEHPADRRLDLRRSHKERRPTLPVPGKLDPGIRKAVEILQAACVETFESCEGGEGHAFPEPTIRFYGGPAEGWRALAVCLNHKLPILALRRVWYVLDSNEPTGPEWEIIFRGRLA
jgi:hypothetical protein